MQDPLSVIISAVVGATVVGSLALVFALLWDRRNKERQEAALRVSIIRMQDTHTMLRWEREFDKDTIQRLQEALRDAVGYDGDLDGVPGHETVAAARRLVLAGKCDILESVVGHDHMRALTGSIQVPSGEDTYGQELRNAATLTLSRRSLTQYEETHPLQHPHLRRAS